MLFGREPRRGKRRTRATEGRVVSGLPSATISGSSRKRERGNEKMNGKEKH